MVVLILSACPAGLRGHLTRWLMELSAGVFVGHVSTKVRDLLWLRVIEMSKNGRALMVYETSTEQRLTFVTHGHHWQPVDLDGITLMLRPSEQTATPVQKQGWSAISKRRRFGQGAPKPRN